jgi:hypothetical protein
MTRIRITGIALLVLLGAGLLSRVTDHADMPPSPAHAPAEIRVEGNLLATETVDLTNGNLHLEIPIRAARQKTAAPRSGH